MHSVETLKKTIEKLDSGIFKYRKILEDGGNLDPVISSGNQKIGNTMNVSLAPLRTCPNCSECSRYCYDVKAVMAYPNVLEARAKNTALALVAPDKYFDGIRSALRRRRTNKYFRWHVAGDITSVEYFDNMVKIAREFPDFRFWTYTKSYHLVNKWCNENGGRESIPENLSVMFSEWQGMPMVNPYGFPEFRVILKGQEVPRDVKWCLGNCNHCIRNCSHCVKGETVYCMEH